MKICLQRCAPPLVNDDDQPRGLENTGTGKEWYWIEVRPAAGSDPFRIVLADAGAALLEDVRGPGLQRNILDFGIGVVVDSKQHWAPRVRTGRAFHPRDEARVRRAASPVWE